VHDSTATARGRPGWWRFLLALFAFIALGYAPAGVAFTPIGPAFVLVGFVTIACVVLGAAQGARPNAAPAVIAVIGIALIGAMPGADDSYRLLVFGWALVLAASFGIVSLLSPAQPFLPRALSTIALAITVGVVGATMFGGGVERVKATVYSEAVRRSDLLDMASQQQFAAERWRDAESRQPPLAALRVAYEQWVHSLPQRTVFLLPSLLALQALAALALGWELFRRLSRTRIGPPLGPLREFSFNDQFVWAIAVGLTILLLPEFAEGRAAGVNILLFFGALFTLRGVGVLASLRRGRVLVPLLIALALVAWPLSLAIALALGLADIWLDVRRRASAAR
jgi:hypothetical protein